MRRTMFMLVVMGTTLALAAGVALAQSSTGAVTSRGSIEFIADTVDCVGETIHVTGNLNSVFHVTENPAGGFHVNGHSNFANTQGVGNVTGLKYRIPTTINSIDTEVPAGEGAALITTQVSIAHVIGVGQVPDQQATAVVHSTIHEDGTVTSEVVHFRFECRNGSPASPSATASPSASAPA